MSTLNDLLAGAGILLADGATGTQLQKAGLKPGDSPERWNLENPEAIRALHRSYLEAGANIVLTNTFGGTRFRLARHGLEGQVRTINETAARLARETAGETALVFGDIGPSGELLKPLGKLAYEEAVEGFAEQAEGLLSGGVDAILIETMSDINEAKAAIEGVRRINSGIPLLVTFSFDTHGRTMMGIKPEKAAREIWALGVTAIGANCGRTLSETLTAIEQMRAAVPEAVLMAKPNAGLPHTSGGDMVYDVTPAVMAEYAQKFAAQQVKIFGGCCGSGPEHIRAVAKALRQHADS
ncbi:MAG: homocysteine S-methyltransferase family protein [Anaerolineales bacterium]|nr:homocysteine S-methyltransferase family protein [Anaerolineales bacterium]MCX7754651.1 homocysteine S-methyltransferase family protein [Anaerolineales bacterium]MDW8278313.1 homocysteine S-methyltransferase family protein [Anaerolineales bacterium]